MKPEIILMINPGTGPIAESTEANAIENMKHFLVDCEIDGLQFARAPKIDYGEGRFGFIVWRGRRCCEVQMPGLPLERVRFMDKPQNPWDFPRLYVDDSSWLWKFAIKMHHFHDDEE